ncbi:hypothetical protein BDR03DRAFT_932955 [Suillus americanus]|nr:hypothetical protein BDR03DRAFT_932955 [Suillus americanus]
MHGLGSTPQSHQSLIDFNMVLPGLQSHYITEIALEAALTAEQTNHLLGLVHHSACGEETFTLQSNNEIWELWSTASQYHHLAPHFVFDAQRLYKFNGTCFVCFIDEPWTANAFWDAQSQLPSEAKPLAFILYADKAKLSSFGTQKAYLIICRIENLPVKICNGTSLGGGRIVGWLPIVSEDSEHVGKSSFVNFKNAIWHESFLKLLESIIQISRTGYWFECGDAIRCLHWPLILILSTDYEEHSLILLTYDKCIMALIHGLKGKFPCPICLAPQDEQSILSDELQLQTRLWRHHLWKELQFWILELGREAVAQMDVNYEAFPQWSNLMHFSKVVGVDFNDSSHHKDISKMAVFVVQRILQHSQSKLGYLILRCIRCYIDLDMYTGFEDYISKSQPVMGKDWNFLKKHASSHLFDDILAKGATWNYNTKPNERMHGPVRGIYHNQTNFKDVATQILHYNHWLLTLTSMHSELDELDQHNRKVNLLTTPDANTENPSISVAPAPCTHVKLGLAQGDISFESLEQSHADDRAFIGFQIKLNTFLNTFICRLTTRYANNIGYESMVDWCQCKDLLRCNPEFFRSPRYDCVMVETNNQPFFARLIFIFGCLVGGTNLSLALIHPYDVGIGVSKHWLFPKFISIRSIIQGAALASDPGRLGGYFVIDTIDADMFL